ncbi:MAG: glutamate-5-semialdehyde dehydrogenase [Deltaproteobacteria bacterium]|nr:glutamate-5-semialdehyde dehydrogenase [Deltaproteobacteria bacterium]MBW2265312.1 glutamate-5-semialdehyde dehydrogenase [Deltaproteobacteria bacterium]MBW2317530.1 glutamate-5-semialdehyde dehydrogenase [Deltaproteobacteria bacterium]MBW2600867.1 glutamate-5-semialdehyde dehydrogenase [Deltaproteobacteria bacterium]OEU46058.1 MAG: glutamate-5-semialdehyde dehydrogenase [Desulfobacterales bacterium S7086C20]
MSVEETIRKMAQSAKKAARKMSVLNSDKKNEALERIAQKLVENASKIKDANEKDLDYGKEKGLSDAMIDRLTVNDAVIESMATGLRDVAALPDPVGGITGMWLRPNGLQVGRVRIPLGVIGMIYEARPNATIDAAGLCLKAGNAVILRGGSEAFHSNTVLGLIIQDALRETDIPEGAAQVIPVRQRDAVNALLVQEDSVDLIIPRGGEGLIRFVVENSKIPILKHYKGVCHIYVDKMCDLGMAEEVSFNAKVQRPGVCNAMETLLVHQSQAESFLPKMAKRFIGAEVELRGCPKTCRILTEAQNATPEDWPMEYLDLILAIKVVSTMDEAIEHIAKYGSAHTESIVTSDYSRARKFLRQVDASVVLVNASTRFNDGGELGLGAEIGISTSKLHAYGPMGLEELTTTKFIVFGDGQIRT